MKLLFYEWPSYLQYDMHYIFRELSVSYDIFSWKFQNKNIDEAFEQWFKDNFSLKQYDAVFSINFWPLISVQCQKQHCKYISFCYDNPLNVEHIEKTLGNASNYIFLFDRIQYQKYCNKGFSTVYHLPLGVNRTRLRNLKLSSDDLKKYFSQVSFVGSLYDNPLNKMLPFMTEHIKGYLDASIHIQGELYGCYLLDNILTEKTVSEINEHFHSLKLPPHYFVNLDSLRFLIACEITRRERLILLNLCGKYFDTSLYSYQDCELLNNVKKCPAVDYVSEMPKAFAGSQINLNASLKAIQSGISLRIFDIMGAGGFLLSNYQEELAEMYQNEKELVIYESYEDAVDKIQFYLSHNTLREEIALKGQRKTLEEHSLQDCLKTMFLIAAL